MTNPMITPENVGSLKLERYRRTKLHVDAVRMPGEFTVVTLHGPVTCQDGWVAIDEAGWPYPIDAKEMRRTYAVAQDDHPVEDVPRQDPSLIPGVVTQKA